MRTELPEKWCILVTSENKDKIQKFYIDHISEYERCDISWKIVLSYYFHYPQKLFGCHSNYKNAIPEYTQITFEEFERLVLKKDSKKYTIEDVKTNPELLVYIPTQEEYNRLGLDFFRTSSFKEYRGPYCYSYNDTSYSSSSSINNTGAFSKNCFIVESKDIITDSWLKKEELQFQEQVIATSQIIQYKRPEVNFPKRLAILDYPLTDKEVYKNELQFQEPCIIKRRKKRR